MDEEDELYKIENYSDNDLFRMLDLTNPTDRELEAKILMEIDKYDNIDESSSKNLKVFFDNVYKHFFEDEESESLYEEEDVIQEGFETSQNESNQIKDGDTPATSPRNRMITTNLKYDKSSLNPILKETQTRQIQLDSAFRDFENYRTSTDYLINLSEVLNNVVSLKLHSVNLPYTWYNVTDNNNANFFQIKGVTSSLKDVYNFMIEVAPGSYDIDELVTALNESIAVLVVTYPDVNFGTTTVVYNDKTTELDLQLDIKNVFTEIQYYLFFESHANTFDVDVRQNTIPSFLGFSTLVIPDLIAIPTPSGVDNDGKLVVSVEDTYTINSIYSNFSHMYNATGSSSGTPNPLNPLDEFQVIVEVKDSSGNVTKQGNNYITFINYEGPGNYVAGTSTILNTVTIYLQGISEDISLTRGTIMESVNRALSLSSNFTANSMFQVFDISYDNRDAPNGSLTTKTMQRFQLIFSFEPAVITYTSNMKQVVIFPDELNFTYPLWKGQHSAFMFDENVVFNQPNSIQGDISPVSTIYEIVSNPVMKVKCTKEYYDNGHNNYSITLNNASYTMNDYVGIINYTEQYKNSEINSKFSIANLDTTKQYINSDIFYDIGANKVRMSFDILTSFDQTDYELDLTKCFLGNDPFNLSDISVQTVDITTAGTCIGMNNGIESNFVADLSDVFTLNSHGLIERDTIMFSSLGTTVGKYTIDFAKNTTYYVKYISNDTFKISHVVGGVLIDITTAGTCIGMNNGIESNFVADLSDVFTLTSHGFADGDAINFSSLGTTVGKYDIAFAKDTTYYVKYITDDTFKIYPPSIISITDPTLNEFTVSTPNTIFPFTLNTTNNKILVTPKAGQGNSTVPAYTIIIPVGTYTPLKLVAAVNNTFCTIQGDNDGASPPVNLNGLNMTQTKLTYTSSASYYSWKFTYAIVNKMSAQNYKVIFEDTGTTYPDNNGGTGSSWKSYLGFTDTSYNLLSSIENGYTSQITADEDVYVDPNKTINIDSTNNSFVFSPYSTIKGLYAPDNSSSINIVVPNGTYGVYQLYNELNNILNLTPETNGSIMYSNFDSGGNESIVLQININKVFSTEDYELVFFDDTQTDLQCNTAKNTQGTSGTTTWDVSIGWLMGFRTYPIYQLSPTNALNSLYVTSNNYTYNSTTKVITLTGDSCVDMRIYKNLYLIIDDFTQNHLNDGLITGVRKNPNADPPVYSSRATRTCNPITDQNQSSIFNANQPGMGLTEKQLYAANIITEENMVYQTRRVYSDPPYVKDMFGLIPLKLGGLSHGAILTEYGGVLQDSTRTYFGPVNITKMNIKLLNDHGDVLDLNGANWSFSITCEYLYNFNGI